MKIVLNQTSQIGLAIFIAIALPFLFHMGMHVVNMMQQTQISMPAQHDKEATEASGNAITQARQAQKQDIKILIYVSIFIIFIFLIIAYFVANPYIQSGLVLSALFFGLNITLLYERPFQVSYYELYNVGIFFAIFLAALFLNKKGQFFKAYFQVVSAFLIAVAVAGSIYFISFWLGEYARTFAEIGALIVFVSSFYISRPLIFVGFNYAAAFLIMWLLKVSHWIPVGIYYDTIVLVFLALALFNIIDREKKFR